MAITLLSGFLLTLLVESLQFFLPERAPAVSDILANTLGTLTGWVCLGLWKKRPDVPERFRRKAFSIWILTVLTIVYLVFLVWIGFQMGKSTKLTNWNLSYPLLFGNEFTGDRSWSGSVEEVVVWDEALSDGDIEMLSSGGDPSAVAKDSMLVHYSFVDLNSLPDEKGCLPDLTWIGGWIAPAGNGINRLDQNQWLITEDSAHCLVERLRSTSQFTIFLTLQTADLYQSGPARIMSISADTARRNLMLGQQGQDLIIRIRTPLTGENGAVPELRFPDVFTNLGMHTIVVSYDGSQVHLAARNDHQGQTFLMNPGVTLLRTFILTRNRTITMDPTYSHFTAIIVILLLLTPVGILFGLWWQIARKPSI